MNGFDMLVLLLVAGVLLLEVRQEAGRSLMDAVAAMLALHFAREYAAPLTGTLGWRPAPDSDVAPMAFALLFGGLLAGGLLLSRRLHVRSRWSMDQFDPLFSFAFGLIVAVAVGHVFTDVTARMAILKHGFLPDYLRDSACAEELRSFRTYHYVVNAFHSAQYGE
jgi:hypothetical protein